MIVNDFIDSVSKVSTFVYNNRLGAMNLVYGHYRSLAHPISNNKPYFDILRNRRPNRLKVRIRGPGLLGDLYDINTNSNICGDDYAFEIMFSKSNIQTNV